MNVNLSADMAEFIREQTREGAYTNQSEVVREGLRLLRSRLLERRSLLLALEMGHSDSKAGRAKPLTDDLLRDIAARGRKRAEEPRSKR